MWLIEIKRFWRNGLVKINRTIRKQLFAVMAILLLILTGCGEEPQMVSDSVITDYAPEIDVEDSTDIEAESIAASYYDIYEEALEEKTLGSLEVMRKIINRLGEAGYSAVDSKNQVNMVGSEQVMRFCEKVDAKEKAMLTIIEVSYLGGFTKYDLQSEDGNIDSVQEYYQYDNGQLKKKSAGSYHVDWWQYTEEGYFMFSGTWFSEELYVLTLSSAEEHAAFRVQPLDEKCRELNRQYLLPISYEQNNMFITDWSEEDFGELNFYDIYDVFYPKMHAQYVPYTAADDLGEGTIYQIPKEEFENVIMTYFNIDSETLQSKTTSHSEDATYEYKPRGFYEVEYPEYPYSEVVSYSENSDGTITLMVNVVFPYEGISRVYAHEVVVRPMGDGGVQYVSNRIIPSESNYKETWHVDRLTEEEWEEYYGGE